MVFLNYLISGISLGSIYAIIALGYTMVYGIAKMLNFAHGDVIMVGGYVVFYATNFARSSLLGDNPSALASGLSTLVCVILAMVVCGVLVLAHLLHDTIVDDEDVQKKLGLPVLGLIPEV